MEPTGVIRDVGVEEIFFSVTDHRGVIRQVNSTFARLSGYSRQELIGSPHNIVRHPMMPGGAFVILWDQLLADRPFAGYLHNLAADGTRYDVFATIVPLPDGGYLSVRTRPLVEDTYAMAAMLYEAAVDLEYNLRFDGMSRADAAQRGADHLRGLMADGDLGTFDDVMRSILPAEVSALDRVLGGLPERPGATGQLREMLDEVHVVFRGLSTLMGRLEPIGALMLGMRDAAEVLQTTIDRSTALAAQLAARPDIDEVEPLLEPLQRWLSMGGEVDALMHELMLDMEQVRDIAAQSRFLIAMARMHGYMTGFFIVELIDGEPEAQEALPAIGSLCEALISGFEALETQAPVHHRAAEEAIRRIEEAARLLEGPARVIAEWKESAPVTGVPDVIADLVPQIDAEIEASLRAVDQLRSIAARCADSGAPSDLAPLREGAERIRAIGARQH